MDRFKYIQVQDKDGNYGDNIPFEIDSQNVLMKDNQTLQKDYDDLILNVQNRVEKEEGKGLSNCNFTQQEKDKLAGIEEQADKTLIDKTVSKEGCAADAKAVKEMIENLRSQMVDTPPITVKSPSEMINHNRIYVYMGETSEDRQWENGCWYYYGKDIEGIQKWLKGGTYSQASSLNDLKDEINQAKEDLKDYTDQTLAESTTVINNYVAEFNATASDLTDRVEEAEEKVKVVDNISQMAQDISDLQTSVMEDFVYHGYVDEQTKIAKFVNKKNNVMFTISGVGGGGGGDIIIDPSMQDDDAATAAQKAAVAAAQAKDQAQIYKDNAEIWATGGTGGTGSDTNNAKYWSNLSRSYAKGNLNPHIRQGEEEDNAEYYCNQAAASAEEAKTALITQRQLAKAWAVGPNPTSEDEEPSDTNNAKYYATKVVQDTIQNWTYGDPDIGRPGQSNQNFEYWRLCAKAWAIGNSMVGEDMDRPTASFLSAREYAMQAYNTVTTGNNTNLVKRTDESPIPGTAEESFIAIETELPNKVDQLESKFKLNNNDGGDDKALYDLLVSLNWWDSVKINE